MVNFGDQLEWTESTLQRQCHLLRLPPSLRPRHSRNPEVRRGLLAAVHFQDFRTWGCLLPLGLRYIVREISSLEHSGRLVEQFKLSWANAGRLWYIGRGCRAYTAPVSVM